MKKIFFVVNKYSGTGFRPDMEDSVVRTCRQNQSQVTLAYTERPGHATTLASEAIANGFHQIIAVGGDGTVNEVAQALINTPARMGIIPKGSGNGLARHLGIPVNFHQALQSLFTSNTVAIDTFHINGKLSLNVSGIGFDGHIAERFGADKQRGFQGYTKLVMNEFRFFREFLADIYLEGREMSKTGFVIAIANSSQYGNNARIAPAASVCDQILDISILRKFPVYRLDLIYALFSGSIDQSAYCETFQIRSGEVRLQEPMPYHVDGEFAGRSDRFSIELAPTSLNMIAPCIGRF